jgi:hypothetical protein
MMQALEIVEFLGENMPHLSRSASEPDSTWKLKKEGIVFPGYMPKTS